MKHFPPFDETFDIWALHRFAEQCALFLAGETLGMPLGKLLPPRIFRIKD